MTRVAGIRAISSVTLLLCSVAVCGCDEDRLPPSVDPGPSAGGGGSGNGSRDAGREDAGPGQDASISVPGCRLPGLENQFTAQQNGEFIGVPIQSAFAKWDCAAEDLVIGIADGSCSPHSGTQFQLRVAREAIGIVVGVGENLIIEGPGEAFFSSTLVFRTPGGGSFGSCEGATGIVNFTALSGVPPAPISGSFDITATSCDGVDRPPILLLGTFDVTLEESFSDACPSSTR